MTDKTENRNRVVRYREAYKNLTESGCRDICRHEQAHNRITVMLLKETSIPSPVPCESRHQCKILVFNAQHKIEDITQCAGWLLNGKVDLLTDAMVLEGFEKMQFPYIFLVAFLSQILYGRPNAIEGQVLDFTLP